jgi:hypothetical protein
MQIVKAQLIQEGLFNYFVQDQKLVGIDALRLIPLSQVGLDVVCRGP